MPISKVTGKLQIRYPALFQVWLY